jgi:hypothetical protein
MTNFDSFYNDLTTLVNAYEKKNTLIKIEKDLDTSIIKIFGENATSLTRAKNGLNDVLELTFTSAEHHPYWNILSSCSEIANSILEKWNESLTKQDIADIEWAIKELKQSFEKINEKFS